MAPNHGLGILRERIEAIPSFLQKVLEPQQQKGFYPQVARRVVATGLGSSEAAARYFVSLLHYFDIAPAGFLPQSTFYGDLPPTTADSHLVLFSQGLSPNSCIPLKQRTHFSEFTLITSSTVEGQISAGKPDRAKFLQQLESEGSSIIHHPLENEYEILPRVIGPACAFATALRLTVPEIQIQDVAQKIIPLFQNPTFSSIDIDEFARDLIQGVDFYFTNETSQYALNLAAKCMETVFCEAPTIRDCFDYAHGPFQAEHNHPKAKWIFTSNSLSERDLVKQIQPLFQKQGTVRVIESPLQNPFSIFFYEAFLNPIVLRAAEMVKANLIDWPGKGEDGEGYSLSSPFQS